MFTQSYSIQWEHKVQIQNAYCEMFVSMYVFMYLDMRLHAIMGMLKKLWKFKIEIPSAIGIDVSYLC